MYSPLSSLVKQLALSCLLIALMDSDNLGQPKAYRALNERSATEPHASAPPMVADQGRGTQLHPGGG